MLLCALHVVQLLLQITALEAVPLARTAVDDVSNSVEPTRQECKRKFPAFLQRTELGHLSVDLWVSQCTTTLRELRENPTFPLHPTHTALLTHLSLSPGGSFYSKRVMGLLTTPVSGEYMFSGQGSGESELWLSTDHTPGNSRRILEITSERQTAPRVNLSANKKYYIEILQTVSDTDSLQIMWHVPGTKDYSIISDQYLSPHSSTVAPSVSLKTPSLPTLPASPQPLTQLLPSTLPLCAVSSKISAISQITPGAVHPADYTDLRNMRSVVLGNQMILPEQAQILKASLLALYPTLQSIESLELYPEGALWLEGRESGGNKVGSWSALRDKEETLCDPNWAVRDQKTVTFIVGVKGQSTWVNHLLNNMLEIEQYSKHVQIQLIIVDFDNGVHTHQLVEHSAFKNVQVIPLTGDFDRGIALARGAEHSPDSSLLFFIDLHLQLPPDIAERAWSRTVRGRSVYAPALVRLNPGHTPHTPNGYWEMGGYGLLAVYKSDYLSSNGHVVKPTYTWGGEDWDLVQKLISSKLVVLRARVPGLYHYHHDRQGMWNRKL